MTTAGTARQGLWWLALAVACAGAPATSQVSPLVPIPQAHDGLVIGGTFDIRYMPVMCIRAPCPPGSYVVTLAGQRIGMFATLIVTSTTDGRNRVTRYEGRYIEGSGTLEGVLRVEGATAHLELRPMTEGPTKN